MFEKRRSPRLWGELYKAMDSSDILVEVLDARDPYGTRCLYLEKYFKQNSQCKFLFLLLNKSDLIPSWAFKKWLQALTLDFPTIAFHASVTNPFGKGALLSALRQLSRLCTEQISICVGFVGCPNVGKSAVINSLRSKSICKVADVPGQTRVCQYVILSNKIFLIDCPGLTCNYTRSTYFSHTRIVMSIFSQV